ncbi:type ISP restriction/modification enzyme [Chroococcidiopsis sp. TS-821]|uniref:type ISP restriction/modification enzyme n=1 Tax=Chroococcidiopsis sp. TS-821 TaxID=1378066 RepID=UPI000CEE6585|nr:type ISP restriction/modification enzyme [Chroococcidiopsis sp. TS-821]PPS41944.1 DNA methyltransferase [Chroococcidiopsis sp. TS-821]
MAFTKENLRAVITGTETDRVEALQQLLGYPIKQRDSQGSRFWYLRPGKTKLEAEETQPIAVGFYSQLNSYTDNEIKAFLTSPEQQQEIYGHYVSRMAEDQPVMYILLPSQEETGRIALVLPTEGKLRQRQIQTFEWNSTQLLKSRLPRLQQSSLPVAGKALFSTPLVEWVFYDSVATAKDLAQRLAAIARQIEEIIPTVYRAESENGYLHQLFTSFQKELLPNLKVSSTDEKEYSFADIYAQTVAYGLFTARVFSYERNQDDLKTTEFNRQTAWNLLPETNPFLRNLFRDISERSPVELGDELIEAIVEIISYLRVAKMEVILRDFHQKINQEDIVIRFYEDFLSAYKPQMRERRGVYYTPQPVVSYIVRSVDHILKKDFGLKDGLADATKVQVKSPNGKGVTETHKVLITDPAVGTGTFLYEVINHIHKSFASKPEQWSDYVAQDLLPRLLGFELLMAPYAVAHMKLGLQLAELGYKFDTAERLRVYLTNTLQEAFHIPPANNHFSNLFWGEADAANQIKEAAPVMVILGNPPYSGHSANNGDWIKNLLKGKDTLTEQQTSSYFEVDGKPLGEKNPKWLNDDYVKFIRFAQWRIEKTGYGVLAFVTNHSYLDNPTFRGMRQSLMETFDDIYVLDLHGNSKKKEKCPDGSKDENVFDIQQGVSINIFVKHPNGSKNKAIIHHADLWGDRDCKYDWLEKNDLTTTQWINLQPQSQFYLFIPQDNDLRTEYEKGWKITEAMPVNVLGFQTHRDHFAIDFDKTSLYKRIADLYQYKISDEQLLKQFDLGTWDIKKARIKLRSMADWETAFSKCLYRPFDVRECYFSDAVMDRPRRELISHVAGKDNLCIGIGRQVFQGNFCHVIVSSKPIEANVIQPANGCVVFPLYIYSQNRISQKLIFDKQRSFNFTQVFFNAVKDKLNYTPTPEAIFYYIYAILHSSTYRTRYAEFLKIDFPRVPLTSSDRLFHQLAAYGEELVALHLMKSPELDNKITQFEERGGHRIIDAGHPEHQQGDVVINKKGDRFIGVPENVWNFYVGGYQVCQKWLKDRKGRTLTQEDIDHYQRIVIALQETIRLMQQIDEVIPGFPLP